MKRSMVASFLCIALITLCGRSFAEDSSTAASAHPALPSAQHSNEWKIKNALSAAPDFIAAKATVMDWPSAGEHHGRILRQGNNGWTCMPDRPGKPAHDPMCADGTMMKWIAATLAGRKPQTLIA